MRCRPVAMTCVVYSTGYPPSSTTKKSVTAVPRARQLAITQPFPFVELTLKGTYLSYVRSAKFMNEQSAPRIALMRNCVAEVGRVVRARASAP